MYRQSLEQHGLSLEEGTPGVPNDGYYYVLFKGETVGRYRALNKALVRYNGIKRSLNLTPVEPQRVSVEEIRQRDMESMSNKRLIWTEEDFVRVDRKTRGKRGTRSAG